MTTMQQEALAGAVTPIYVSYSTFVNLLEWLKAMRVIPSQLDRSLWKEKFAGSTGAQLMTGLRFLKLLDGSNPLPSLEDLVKADKENRRRLMREVLAEVYGTDMVEGLESKTPKLVDDRLKELGTTDATHRKAVSFFINAAKANGVDVPASIAKKARIRGGKPRNIQKPLAPLKPKGKDGGKDSDGKEQKPPSDTAEAQQSLMLWGLFKRLPSPGNVWAQEERDKWIEAAKTLFNLEYKEK